MRELVVGLRDDVGGISLGSPRAIVAAQAVASVGLAVIVAHAMELHDCWWAAISAFIVMQTGFGASLYRGLLRMIGTACGAALGFLVGQSVADLPIIFIPLMGVATWAGLYAGLCYRHSYAWVLGVVTFVMVMCEAMSQQAGLERFAWDRFSNVVVGTLACILVAGLSDSQLRASLRGWVTRSPDAATRYAWNLAPPRAAVDRREVAWHALTGAIAVMFLSAASDLLQLKSFPQAMITTIALLVIPVTPGASDLTAQVLRRMTHRFAGCLIAGLIACAVLPLIETQTLLCQLALGLGVWAGAYLQGGPVSVRYMGTQFSVAFIMVFVQDRGWTVDVWPALERLAGVFAGILIVALILFGVIRARGALR